MKIDEQQLDDIYSEFKDKLNCPNCGENTNLKREDLSFIEPLNCIAVKHYCQKCDMWYLGGIEPIKGD